MYCNVTPGSDAIGVLLRLKERANWPRICLSARKKAGSGVGRCWDRSVK
jgi:hypothetical protein